VERYAGKPVVLLGVNTDADRDRVRQVVAEKGINWRSWWAGAPDGEIPTRWRIQGYPSLFVLDARGVVRYENVQPGVELEQAIERLLRE
jgi:hypothetical protein